jgi:4-hydroxybenzoyl-CoA reductase subunit beta
MRLPNFEYCEPTTLDEALIILAENQGEARVLAGGTDLIPLMKYGLAVASTIVSLKNVTDLKGIILQDQEISIGAMTSLADIVSSPVIRNHFLALLQAAEAVAAPPIWNVATLGGNLCQNSRCLYYNQSKAWRLERPPCLKAGGKVCHAVPKGKKCFSVYSGDLAPALMALRGRVSVKKKNQSRIIPLQDIFSGNGLAPFTLAQDELVTGVILPLPGPRDGSSFIKMRVRSAVDYPLLSAAASLTLGAEGKTEKALLVLGAVGPAPVVVPLDRLFAGKNIDTVNPDALRECVRPGTQLVDNLALPGSYRRSMLPVIAQKAIQGALTSLRRKETL